MLDNLREYMERKNGVIGIIERLWVFFGGTAGLATALIVAFNYGAFVRSVEALREGQKVLIADVQKLKDTGTREALDHIRRDDERDAALSARVKFLEDAYHESTKANTDIQVSIAQLKQKLDDWMITLKKGP